jgi:uncharacterized protein YukE
MGTTGTVNITPEMMRNAIDAITDYETKASAIKTKLDNTFSALYPGNFSGNAAEGFKAFNEDKIQPLIGEGLTGLTKALREMCEGILKAIPDTDGLDDQLGSENSK